MSTVQEIIDRLSKLEPTSIVAVPTVWEKETAEEVYEYATGEFVPLSNEDWAKIVELFEDADVYDEEAMIDAINEVLGR